MFFGPKHNLIMPGPALGMSDGWETRRRRGPGNDWVVVQLAAEANLSRIEIDTSHFKGNYPDTCSIDGDGQEMLPRTKLQPDTRHVFVDELADIGPVKEVRLNVYPDGGVARLRVYGKAIEDAKWREVARRINTRVRAAAEAELRSCCGSSEWVRQMMASRPFDGGSELLAGAETIWQKLDPQDWREAFAAHPRIGENPKSEWARQEQAGAAAASSDTMRALAEVNREYEKRFGYIFIVFATGKTADEMLAIARQRLKNPPEQEIKIAADQQLKIMKLRLMKLVS